jgi:pimeloyl-ACP methyl ester carboxylesterase
MSSARNVGRWLAGQRNDNIQMAALAPMDLAGIDCPTLIVQGTADHLAAPHSAYAAEHIPGAEVLTIPNGGHRGLWVHDDYAEQLAAVVTWLRTRAPA